MALPPAGTVMPVTVSGASAATVGVACSTPLT